MAVAAAVADPARKGKAMGEQILCEQATGATIGRLVELSEKLRELHESLLAGDPDEILRVAEAVCLLVDGLERSESTDSLADYVNREDLADILARVKKQARLNMIIANCALRVGGRTMAALRGTAEYGPTGQRVPQSASCRLPGTG
jgi:hypothetical protein